MTTLDSSKSLIFMGDHHGMWSNLFHDIETKDISNCYIIHVGDCGIGFESENYQLSIVANLNKLFEEKNITFLSIRGNHDDPNYFKGDSRIAFSNFELLEDYTILKYKNDTIQFIGGAISLDRSQRELGASYWKDEEVVYDKDKLQKVDILVTHTAPSWCHPQQFNEMVFGWAGEDANLLKDLKQERKIMDDIFEVCKPSFHVYGHFHDSYTERINGCVHKLLDIEEMYELFSPIFTGDKK